MKNKLIGALAITGTLLAPAAAMAQTERVTLLETFTSSTCPPCNPGNIVLEGLIADPQNNGKQVSLKYQMSWPGNGDPYFTDEADVRRDVYLVSGVPATRVDGQTEYNTGSLTQANLNAAYAVDPKLGIYAYYTIDEANKTVDVHATVEALVNTPPGVRLYIAIFEYETFNNVESNGETEFFHVMKKMMPGPSGTVMSPMTIGETYEYNGSYTFNGNYNLPANALDPIDHTTEHSVEEFSDLGVVVWAQTLSNREVYQAGYATLSALSTDEMENSVATAKLYPNPSNESTVVAYHLTTEQDVKIEVVNALGQIVSSDLVENAEAGRNTYDLNTSMFTNGLYSVRISGPNGMLTKRLSVQH